MTRSLYEISAYYLEALEGLDCNPYLTDEIIEDSLVLIKDDFKNKGIAVANWYKNGEAEALALAKAEKDFKTRRKIIERRLEATKKYLKENMQKCGITKIENSEPDRTCKISLGKGIESVKILDESIIPDECFELVKKLSKTKVKEYIQKNGFCEGATLERTPSLSIK